MKRSLFAGAAGSLSFLIVLTLAAPALSSGGAAAAEPTAWTPELSMKVKGVGGGRVSPDGKRVLFTVNESVMTADKSEYVTQIWTANADGTDAYQMTFGEKSSGNPVAAGPYGTGNHSFYSNETNVIYESEGGQPPHATPQDRVPKNGAPIY